MLRRVDRDLIYGRIVLKRFCCRCVMLVLEKGDLFLFREKQYAFTGQARAQQPDSLATNNGFSPFFSLKRTFKVCFLKYEDSEGKNLFKSSERRARVQGKLY